MNGQLLSFPFCLIYLQVKQVMRNTLVLLEEYFGFMVMKIPRN